MTMIDPTTQTLSQLGAADDAGVAALFADVRRRFEERIAIHSTDQESWKAFLIQWTGRKSGILSQITDNWLKAAPPELKRAVGQELNKLKAHVEAAIEEKRVQIEAAADQAAKARCKRTFAFPASSVPIGTAPRDSPDL